MGLWLDLDLPPEVVLLLLCLLVGALTCLALLAVGVLALPFPILTRPGDLSPDARAVAFSTSDGFLLRGFYAPPKDGRPVLVLGHGQGSCRDSTIPWGSILARAGYGVLCFDWRAHGQSAGWWRSFGWCERLDLIAAIDFLSEDADSANRPIGVYSCSYGAACSAMAAGGLPPSVMAMVLDCPFGDLGRMIAYRTEGLGSVGSLVRVLLDGLSMLLTGSLPSQVQPEVTLCEFAPRPILVTHGALDRMIPPSESRSLIHRYPGPKEYWEVDDDGHVRARRTKTRVFMQRLARFFETALPGAPSAEEVVSLAPESMESGAATLRSLVLRASWSVFGGLRLSN